jgi:hypothetical protein
MSRSLAAAAFFRLGSKDLLLFVITKLSLRR